MRRAGCVSDGRGRVRKKTQKTGVFPVLAGVDQTVEGSGQDLGLEKMGKKRQAARMLEIKGERAGREGPGNAGGPGIRARGVGNTGRGTRTEGGPGKH